MNLRLGSIPVRINAGFFLMTAFLGLNERDPARLAMWVVIVLVSVIVHELGHALMGMAFGLRPRIVLHGMGGLTMFDGLRAPLPTRRSVAVSLAGPVAGFVFAALVFAAGLAGLSPSHPLARHAVTLLFFVNVAWGVFNLLPMLPLDGGNVLRSVVSSIAKQRGEKIARVVSIAVAAGIGVWAVGRQQWWVLYLGVLFAFQNVQALRQVRGQIRVDQTLADAIEKGHAALDRQEPAAAAALLKPALATGASSSLRQVGLRIYVVALMKEERWGEAVDVMERERTVIGGEDLGRYATAMRDLGRSEDAARIDELVKAPAPLSEFRA